MGFTSGRLAALMAATITVATPALMARAQVQPSARPPSVTSQGAPLNDLPLADYQAFDQFSAGHPDIISELGHHPQLIEDQDYLAKHPQLRDFLATHTELRSALINDPGDFIELHGTRPPL